MKLREVLAQAANMAPADATFAEGMVRTGNREIPLAQLAGTAGLVAEHTIEFGDLDKNTKSPPSVHTLWRSVWTPLGGNYGYSACWQCVLPAVF